MAEPKLHSGMSFQQIQDYCDKRVGPTTKDEKIIDCDSRSEVLMLIANLAARMKENNA